MEFESGRYARHRLLDWFDQDQIAKIRAFVVGAGAIGNEVLKNLALLGVQKISIIDMDHIEIHNLTRSVLFRESDVGCSKAQVAADRVKELLPEVEISVLEGPLEVVLRPSLIAKHDVVFSCLDNFEARLALDEMCQLAKVDLINGAIDARYATVEAYPYGVGHRCGCYSCNLPAGAFQRVAQRYSCGWLRRIGLVERKVPTTIITSSLAASMMASWGLRLGMSGCNSEPLASKRLLADTFSGRNSTSDLLRNESCPSCCQLEDSIEILTWSGQLELGSAITAKSVQARLPTEVVFSAHCAECGFDVSETIVPGSKLRGYSTDARICPSCHAEAVVIDARDIAKLDEIAALRNGKAPDLPYILVNIGKTTYCVEIIND